MLDILKLQIKFHRKFHYSRKKMRISLVVQLVNVSWYFSNETSEVQIPLSNYQIIKKEKKK